MTLDVETPVPRPDDSRLRPLVRNWTPADASDPFAELNWLPRDILLSPPSPRLWLLKHKNVGALALGKVAALVGAGGAGKTMVESALALSVASGRPFLDVFDVAEPGAVFLGLGEETSAEIHRRLCNAAGTMGLSRDERQTATARIMAAPLAGKCISLTHGDGRGNIGTSLVRDQLLRRLESFGCAWRLIILDPLSRWAGNDVEKDSHAATRFIEVLEELTELEGNPAVLFAHHTSKNARTGGGQSGTSASRGVTALTDGARAVINLDTDGPDVVKLSITKSNYAPAMDPVLLVRDREFFGALRAMTQSEAAAHEAMTPARRGSTADEEIDQAIVDALRRHGPQQSQAALVKLVKVAARNDRKRDRIKALATPGGLVIFDGTIYRLSSGQDQ